MTPLESVSLTSRLWGLSICVQGLEYYFLGGRAAASFDVQKRPLSGISARVYLPLCGALLLGCGISLIATGDARWSLVPLPLLYLTSLLFGGTFNGGSDYLTFVVGIPLAFAGGVGTTVAARLASLAIGVQLFLSYTIAGFGKLGAPEWRSGAAVRLLAQRRLYAIPSVAERILSRAPVSKILCTFTLLLECAAPLALLHPLGTFALLTSAALFHLGIALALGLNRFVWAWFAAYPSALFLAESLHRGPP